MVRGSHLGPYEIAGLVGSGGMGEVYRARDTRLGRDVAVKVLPAEFADHPERVRRFEQEARAVAALNHPNILSIYDVGEQEGAPYLVTELLEGESLREMLVEGPIPVRKAINIGAQVAEGLAAAHEKGIVHRDLKPGNVFITKSGHVKILDFGLARLASLEPGSPVPLSEAETKQPATCPGVVMGTVGYMSPEQVKGRPADARSDIFAFGIILHEMLSGKGPFGRDSVAESLAAVLKEDPPPISGLAPSVARLIERCLKKEPLERFQSVAELRSAIQAWETSPPIREKQSVAVFPFANITGRREDDFLCEGLAEEIIDALTHIVGLRVIARTSAFAVARLGLDLGEAGKRLGAAVILEGSVRRAGKRVRVTAQLAATSDGSQIWSQRYDREMTDVLAIEEEIAVAIAESLRIELTPDERLSKQAAVDPQAHVAYLEGRYHFARGTPDSMTAAKNCYEKAVELAPDYALAYDSLAELYWYFGFFGNMPPRDAFSQSTWLAMRALELDHSLAQTHALLGMLRKELDYKWSEVERELHLALDLCPNSPLVLLRRVISSLLPSGRVVEAMEELDKLLETDPLSIFLRWWLSISAYLAREPERTIEEGRRMIALDTGHFLGHWSLGIGLGETGAIQDAVLALEKSHDLSGGSPFTLGFLAQAYGRAGRRVDANRLLGKAEAMAASTYVPPSVLAVGYSGLEEWEHVLEWLGKAIDARDPIIVPIKTFPWLDPVRDDPRFARLLHRMNLE